MKNVFNEIKNRFNRKTDTAQLAEISKRKDELRKRTENVLLTDKLSDEIKKMVESGSGCGFIALLRVIRHLDSDILSNRKKQAEFIQSFQKEYESLDADLGPSDLVRFCKENDLGVKIIDFYYSFNLGTPEQMMDEVSSQGDVKIDFPMHIFRPDIFDLTLEPDQVAIFGLEKRTDQGIEGHYLCSDRNEILSNINPGGSSDLRKYLKMGYKISDVLVFEKKQEEQG